MSQVFQDWSANRGNVKGQLVLSFFRFAQIFALRKGSFLWYLGLPVMIVYRLLVEYLLCIELRAATRVGSGLVLEHGFSLVVNDRTVIGKNVHLRHCVTIGCVKLDDGSQGPSPVIEDNVEIGANSCVIGGITVGRGSKIGAGSVVVKDVPPSVVVAGNPARVIKGLENLTAVKESPGES